MRAVVLAACLLLSASSASGEEVALQLVVISDAHKSAADYRLAEFSVRTIEGLRDLGDQPRGSVSWFTLGRNSRVLLSFTALGDLRRQALEDAEGAYDASDEKRDLTKALLQAIDELRDKEGRKAIAVFIAAGLSGESAALDSDVSRKLRDDAIEVHVVSLGEDADLGLAKQIADESGGIYYITTTPQMVGIAVKRLLSNLDRTRRGRSMTQWVGVPALVSVGEGEGAGTRGDAAFGFWGWLFVTSWGLLAAFVLFRFYRMARDRSEAELYEQQTYEEPPPPESFDPEAYFGGQGETQGHPPVLKFTPVDSLYPEFEANERRETSIGRRKSCHVVLDYPGCSGNHAVIVWRDGQAHVVDKGSTNGTFLNDERVTENAIRVGDVVTFNTIAYRVESVRVHQNEASFESSSSEEGGATMMLSSDDPELQRMMMNAQESNRRQVPESADDDPIEIEHAHCLRHKNRLASGLCDMCTLPYCPDCLDRVLDQELCPRCRAATTGA
jgi:hypothetical protein